MSNIKQITVNNNTYNLYDSTAARSIVLGTTDDLNSITTPGIYSCGGSNSVKNKPSGTDGIGVIVVHNATGDYYTQILTTSSNANTYRRTCINGTWSAWTVDKYTDTNTDTKMAQMAVAGTSTYSNYRPLLIGESNNATKDFTPSRVVGTALAFKNLYVRPSVGLIHATTFEGKATSASSADNASKVNGHTVNSDVPSGAKFTDTTYSAATTSVAGLMSAADKTKLDGIAAGANKYTYTLPTAGSSVLGGVKIGTTLSNSTGQLQVVTSKLNTATQSASGIMSSGDKTKLDNIAEYANNYSLPDASVNQKGGVKVGSNITVTAGTISLTKANVTAALGYTPPTTNTTYGSATATSLGLVRIGTTIARDSDGKYNVVTSKLAVAGTATAGLMSETDKKKLNHIAENANNYSLPKATSTALGGVKINGNNLSIDSNGVLHATNTTYSVATTSANGLMSSSDKTKLNGLSNAPVMAMGVRGTVPGTPSVSDTSNSNRYLSGGTNGQGEWRALPSVAHNTSGLSKTFKKYTSAATIPNGYGSSATAPTINSITTTTGRYYGVENDSQNRLFVNVPWTDTVGVTGTGVTKLRVLNQSTYNTATKYSNEIYFILE